MNKIKKILNIIILSTFLFFVGMINIYAASAKINVSSSTNKVVIGKTFTVTVTVSSSITLGAWDFTINYDTSKFKMTSGETRVADPGDGKVKSKSYTYKFKAIAKGSGKISVKSASVRSWDSETEFSTSIGSKTITVITQAELEASYSKNNNLKSLEIQGLTLSPNFNKDVTQYTVNAESNVQQVNIIAKAEDSKSHISNTGVHEVSEGENKFEIVVTAENGSTKTYIVNINVVDPNPITVKIDNKNFTVVKRESNLIAPEGFEKKEVEINEQKVPGLYNKLNNYTLVGLKDENGETNLYLYDKNNYTKYIEASLNQVKLFPLSMDMELSEEYKKTDVTINEVKFDALQIKNSEYFIIHARNILTGKDDYYIYDSNLKTVIRYTDENTKSLNKTIKKYKKIILVLGFETILAVTLLICVILTKDKAKKVKKNKIEHNEIQEKINDIEKLEKEVQEEIIQEKIDNIEELEKEIQEEKINDLKEVLEEKKKVKKNTKTTKKKTTNKK